MNYRILRLFILILLWLVLMTLAALAGQVASRDAGYVLVSIGRYTLETSFWLAAAAWCLSVAIVYGSVWLLGRLRIYRSLSRWNHARLANRASRMMNDGLRALARGQFKLAYKLLTNSAKRANIPAINYLLAAYAAHHMGNNTLCDECLTAAETTGKADPVMAGLLQSMVQIQRKDYEQALATLTRIRGEDKNPFKLELLRQVYDYLQDWENLDQTLKRLDKIGRSQSSEVRISTEHLIINRLKQADAKTLDKVWNSIDSSNKQEPVMLLTYCHQLTEQGRQQQAEVLLRKHISQQYDRESILAYGLLNADAKQQLLAAESWLRERPNNIELLVTLGRLSLKNQLWGKALEYLKMAVSLGHCPLGHAELARLYAAMGEQQLSHEHLQQYVAMTESLPQLPMPDHDQQSKAS
ncbi:heme biosynthesis HemY N-terminal domain-containing protein [Gynuella sunshinyii]|uniref:Putative enzyme of heme biosynthesis n=1 Tax=Gynuella sunshinyii YC6258 TaxID=1445510 RepID=A0A0C5VH32_9GAMM|nr:heme biosynthesis HemY N-terminal domain-containing protein [Gynuella sunshinyii]AJQ93546.1 putative enzyme of heme biosynthesis [Gynuella sunshinyii YC6258]